MRIEISRKEGRVCLLISPIAFSIAEHIATSLEDRVIVATLGTCVTAIANAPGDECVAIALYFDHLDTGIFVTLNHLIKPDKPIPIIVG
ncbi:MAG: hypothetical protein KH310_11355 [Enterobacteriaceae bacterium]|nr:hypothetical protein [Enterobacteriaceae bacterium]